MTFQDARDGLAKLLKDTANRLTPDDKDKIIIDAVRQFGRRIPRIVAKEISGTGAFDYALPSDFVEGVSSIKRIYFPFDPTFQNPAQLRPKEFEVFRREASTKLRFKATTPSPSETFLMVYSVPHTADPAGSDVVADLTTSFAFGPGINFSSSVNVESASDARIFLQVSAVSGTLDVFIQASQDGIVWADAGALDQVAAPGDFVELLRKHRVSKFVRLRYEVSAGGSATLAARVERESPTGSMTVKGEHGDILSLLSASLAARSLADFYAGTSDSTLRDDTTDYEGKSTFWSDLADKWEASFKEEVGKILPEDSVSAFAQGRWDLKGQTGYHLLVHDEFTK